MTIYFEGNGTSRPVTISECRDQFIYALKDVREDILEDPALEAYEDRAERDLYLVNRAIGGVLNVLDGNSDHFPAVNLIPYETAEDTAEAKEAGANYIDLSGFSDFGQGLSEYWFQVNS